MQCYNYCVNQSELFYGGESHSVEQPQSYTCPLCGEVGLSENDLRDHVTRAHTDSANMQEVVRYYIRYIPGVWKY